MVFCTLFAFSKPKTAFQKFKTITHKDKYSLDSGSAFVPFYQLPAGHSELKDALHLLQDNDRSTLQATFYDYLDNEFSLLLRTEDKPAWRRDVDPILGLTNEVQWKVRVDRFVWILSRAKPYIHHGDLCFIRLAEAAKQCERNAEVGFTRRLSVTEIHHLRMKLMPFAGEFTFRDVYKTQDNSMYLAMLDCLNDDEIIRSQPATKPEGCHVKIETTDHFSKEQRQIIMDQNDRFLETIPLWAKIELIGIDNEPLTALHERVSTSTLETANRRLREKLEGAAPPAYKPPRKDLSRWQPLIGSRAAWGSDSKQF